jgi:NAD(P)-dependent dehydrogenase (short-subunit alcohol dehydrogenase family)
VLAVVTGTALVDAVRAVAGADVRRLDHPDELEGPVDALVLDVLAPEAREPRPLADVDDARWGRVWEGTMRTTVAWFQAVFPGMRDAGRGRIVVVTPTVSMSGAAGLAPLCAVVEAQRVLAKSTARQWGRHGITVNCLATPTPGGAQALAPAALAGVDVGAVLRFLLSDDAGSLTGATLCVDGGVWMGAP